MLWVLARRSRALRLSNSLVRIIFKKTRSQELHSMSTSIAAIYREKPCGASPKRGMYRHYYSGPWARIDVKRWPMHSWLGRTAQVRCERELCRPSSTPETAYRVLGRLVRAARWRHEEAVRRISHGSMASPRLHAATGIFGRRSERIEHLAGALCRSPTDTHDRIGRGHCVEGHEHARRLQRGRPLPVDPEEMQGASAERHYSGPW